MWLKHTEICNKVCQRIYNFRRGKEKSLKAWYCLWFVKTNLPHRSAEEWKSHQIKSWSLGEVTTFRLSSFSKKCSIFVRWLNKSPINASETSKPRKMVWETSCKPKLFLSLKQTYLKKSNQSLKYVYWRGLLILSL